MKMKMNVPVYSIAYESGELDSVTTEEEIAQIALHRIKEGVKFVFFKTVVDSEVEIDFSVFPKKIQAVVGDEVKEKPCT